MGGAIPLLPPTCLHDIETDTFTSKFYQKHFAKTIKFHQNLCGHLHPWLILLLYLCLGLPLPLQITFLPRRQSKQFLPKQQRTLTATCMSIHKNYNRQTYRSKVTCVQQYLSYVSLCNYNSNVAQFNTNLHKTKTHLYLEK
jgi:hypothetical protein